MNGNLLSAKYGIIVARQILLLPIHGIIFYSWLRLATYPAGVKVDRDTLVARLALKCSALFRQLSKRWGMGVLQMPNNPTRFTMMIPRFHDNDVCRFQIRQSYLFLVAFSHEVHSSVRQ
jgi:hypothetical protein